MGVSKTIAGYEMWKDEYDFSENPINSILKIYVRFNKLEKEEPEITDKARNVLQRLEAGDKDTTDLWKWIISISLESYNKIYDLIGCKFDSYNGEAFYNDKMDRVVKIRNSYVFCGNYCSVFYFLNFGLLLLETEKFHKILLQHRKI